MAKVPYWPTMDVPPVPPVLPAVTAVALVSLIFWMPVTVGVVPESLLSTPLVPAMAGLVPAVPLAVPPASTAVAVSLLRARLALTRVSNAKLWMLLPSFT